MKDLKVDILAIGVHPDDVELCCSGTLMKHIHMGYSAAIVDLTKGELGTRGSAALRLEEAETARAFMGVRFRENLGMRDGFFEHNEQNLNKVIRAIRTYQPTLVLANAKRDRHPDHGRAAALVSEACFYSGLHKIRTERDRHSQTAWRPRAVYHYIQDYNLEPDFVVDISDWMDRKIEAIQQFKSQFYDPASKEPESPISSLSFLEFIRAKARTYGRHIGAEYGEGFQVNRYLGVDDLFHLK